VDRPELTISADAPVAFVDVETTGGHAGLHRIIDIAVIGATGGRLDFEWQSLVNPGVHVPAGITALTGIDNAMLEDAPPFERIAKELRERLAGRVFVAHNARFDYGFVRRELAGVGDTWHSPMLCTVRLSRALYPGMPRHNLDAVMEKHGFVIEKRHRAMPDAQVLWMLWQKLRAEWPAVELQQAIEAAAPRIQLPAALPPDLADDLPEMPGVYRFFGVGDDGVETLLYVGKAKVLRDRVLEHFRVGAVDLKTLRLATQVRRVEWTETAGELGAMLLEAREIRETQPLYNRRLRGGSERLTWLFAEGAAAPELVTLDVEVLGRGNAFGTYRCERDARKALESLAREHQWCLKLLGFETGPGSCFGFQVGRCRGACVAPEARSKDVPKESAAVHLTRVKLGLMPLRLAPWPHDGPMVLREGYGERAQYHVIDAWQHLASFDAEAAQRELAELASTVRRSLGRRDARFDLDAYRILTRHLRDRRLSPLPATVSSSANSDESSWS
jgi:DNA polymerase-3 subunit epsilon